jgi:sarcosine oxidase
VTRTRLDGWPRAEYDTPVTPTLDCIVAGLGAAGGAALYHLAGRGVRVAGFDRFAPPHAHGSSHGETRMIREAYHEDPRYVPLVRRAYDLWHDLSTNAPSPVIRETGGLFTGRPWEELVTGIRRSGDAHAIAIETIPQEERSRRVPWLRPDGDMVTITEPRAGFLLPERCITAHLEGARARGAAIHVDEPVTAWRSDRGTVVVETSKQRYTTRRLMLCTGAWMTPVGGDIGAPLTVTRQTLFWFRPRGDATSFSPERFPVWAVEYVAGRLLYGFPDVGSGLKVAVHYGGAPTTVDAVDRAVSDDEIRDMTALVDRYLPGITDGVTKTAVCLYTNTPDCHFLVDTHPSCDRVLVVSACSGHGFKFSSAIGEAAAQWATDGAWTHDLSLFSRRRFA